MPLSKARHKPRIRLQLTALYAATLLVVLLGTAAMLRLAVHAMLERELQRSVSASALLVRQFFRVEIAEYGTTEATLAHIAGELVFEGRSLHIRRPDGQIFRTVGAPERRIPVEVSGPIKTVSLPLDEGMAPQWMIEVEASTESMHDVQRRLDRWMLIGIPGAVLVAAVMGWWLTGRTLRPVGVMADAAASISPASGIRLPIENPTDELGRLGHSFNALLDRLDGALQQQHRFLADAAHELRTPLARMRARMDVAQLTHATSSFGPGRSVLPPDDGSNSRDVGVRTVLGELQDDLKRMTRLVDELLQLARADAGDDSRIDAMKAVFLDDIVADELRRWSADAVTAGVALQSSTLTEAPVHAEPTLIGRLLGILIDNALRYSQRGGRLDVRVRTEGALTVLEVEDDGIGIPDAERGRVFDRFYRGDRARALRNDGSGLGLAIAAWIVKLHGGTIAAERARTTNGQNAGTVFTVRLPLRAVV